jgi:multiple sugar transport system substrate-binding protein
MALFYNKRVFDKYKIAVPTTWAQYIADAEKLHAADPKEYMTSDSGDAGATLSMIWQAGGRPYKVDGTTVNVNFGDAGSQKYATMWQPLITKKLLSPVAGWTNEWFQGLANGTIASLVTGAWMPPNLESSAPTGSGDWRVAPMPQYSDGDHVTAENGGSAMSVMQASKNKELAYAFVHYADAGPGVQSRAAAGAFPATEATLQSASFLSAAPKYFGGQQINKVLSKAAEDVAPGWQYSPFQVYANSIFKDTVGKAYTSPSTSLQEGLNAWQQATVKYGSQEGFTVNK